MALVRWRPMERDWLKDVDRMLGDVRHMWGSEPAESVGWAPDVNIFEMGDDLVLEADLPGVGKDQIHVEVQNQSLTLRGERKRDEKVADESYYRCERPYGTFSRVFTLPTTVDVTKIDASFKDGVLTVKLPKTAEAKAKQIAIH
jgi:HSP20 family protein